MAGIALFFFQKLLEVLGRVQAILKVKVKAVQVDYVRVGQPALYKSAVELLFEHPEVIPLTWRHLHKLLMRGQSFFLEGISMHSGFLVLKSEVFCFILLLGFALAFIHASVDKKVVVTGISVQYIVLIFPLFCSSSMCPFSFFFFVVSHLVDLCRIKFAPLKAIVDGMLRNTDPTISDMAPLFIYNKKSQ